VFEEVKQREKFYQWFQRVDEVMQEREKGGSSTAAPGAAAAAAGA
jgi:hypothetical protein